MSTPPTADPYEMEEEPTSEGRIFLAQAFTFCCALEWGFSPREISMALAGAGDADVRARVAWAAREIGRCILHGGVESYARPFGGGTPIRLTKTQWELDDFAPRFAKSAIDPKNPFDPEARCTHWIFVDAEQFDVIVGRYALVAPTSAAEIPAPAETPASPTSPPEPGRFLRMPEVLSLVGMSRSTMYERMKTGRFPKSVELGGNMVVWREMDVRSWMDRQGGQAPP